jgi:hypothetical protein
VLCFAFVINYVTPTCNVRENYLTDVRCESFKFLGEPKRKLVYVFLLARAIHMMKNAACDVCTACGPVENLCDVFGLRAAGPCAESVGARWRKKEAKRLSNTTSSILTPQHPHSSEEWTKHRVEALIRLSFVSSAFIGKQSFCLRDTTITPDPLPFLYLIPTVALHFHQVRVNIMKISLWLFFLFGRDTVLRRTAAAKPVYNNPLSYEKDALKDFSQI